MLSGSASTRYRIRFHERASIAHAQNARTAGAGELAVAASRMRGNLHRANRKSGTATCRFRAWNTSTKRQRPHRQHLSSPRPPPPAPARRWSPRSRRRACSRCSARSATAPPSAILARAPAAGAGDFGVAGGVPVSSGIGDGGQEGGDKVKIKAPTVTMDGSAWLKKDRELGTTAYIGDRPEPRVARSRGAVYRHGGDPAGEITADAPDRQRQQVGLGLRRRTTTPSRRRSRPSTGSPARSTTRTTTPHPAKATHLGTPSDTPEFNMPVNDGPGRITTFKGHDNFKMGMAIKKEVRDLDARPARPGRWTGTSRSTRTSAARARPSRPRRSQDLLKDGPDVSLTAWSLDPRPPCPFEAFSTQTDAMKRTPGAAARLAVRRPPARPGLLQEHLRRARRQGARPRRSRSTATRPTRMFGKDALSASVKRQRRADQDRVRHPPQQRRVAHGQGRLGRGDRLRGRSHARHGDHRRALRGLSST